MAGVGYGVMEHATKEEVFCRVHALNRPRGKLQRLQGRHGQIRAGLSLAGCLQGNRLWNLKFAPRPGADFSAFASPNPDQRVVSGRPLISLIQFCDDAILVPPP